MTAPRRLNLQLKKGQGGRWADLLRSL